MSETFDDIVDIRDANATVTLRADANDADLVVGGGGPHGDVFVVHGDASAVDSGQATGRLNGRRARLRLGDNGVAGDVRLQSENGDERMRLLAETGRASFGGNGVGGTVLVHHPSGDNSVDADATLSLDGGTGSIRAGGGGIDGEVTVEDNQGDVTVHINGQEGNITLGGGDRDGDLVCRDNAGDTTVHINGQEGNITLGGGDRDGDLVCRNSNGVTTIHLNGASGDILLENADCAEDFEAELDDRLGPGAVVVMNDHSRLETCAHPYDRRVAGIVAGAADRRPGIVLGRKNTGHRRVPVALMGTVYCRVDAGFGAVKVGDLLTTSVTPGHAMKVSHPVRAFGAVVGKALGALDEGRGLIPILVALQ